MLEGRKIEIPPLLLETELPTETTSPSDGRLHATARDPQWLYVHWDFTREQQTQYNTASSHGHLVIRVHLNHLHHEPCGESHVHPQSRHWFVHVEKPGAAYFAEIGYYVSGDWHRVAAAGPVTTPRTRLSLDTRTTTLTIHPDLPLLDQLTAVPEKAPATNDAQPAGADASAPDNTLAAEQELAVLRALGLFPATGTFTNDSGMGESLLPAAEFAAAFSWFPDSASSPDGGFNPTTPIGGAPSSTDAPWFSPADIAPSSA